MVESLNKQFLCIILINNRRNFTIFRIIIWFIKQTKANESKFSIEYILYRFKVLINDLFGLE